MSRWAFDITTPPPQAWEAVDGAAALLKTSGLLVSSTLYLASIGDIYAHEEPVDKPARWVLVTEMQHMGGRRVDDSGLLKVELHVKVVSERQMVNRYRWHGDMHKRIRQALVNKKPTALQRGAATHGYRQITEPSRAEHYDDTDTHESFAVYAINLEPVQPSE